MRLTSPHFDHQTPIPARYTCDGQDISPQLIIGDVPEGTQSLALIVDDPDAPGGTWVHWLLWNVAPTLRELPEGSEVAHAVAGTNDFGGQSWGGPCPPSGRHRYFFRLYALDDELTLEPGSRRDELEAAMRGHIIDQTELIGTRERTT